MRKEDCWLCFVLLLTSTYIRPGNELHCENCDGLVIKNDSRNKVGHLLLCACIAIYELSSVNNI